MLLRPTSRRTFDNSEIQTIYGVLDSIRESMKRQREEQSPLIRYKWCIWGHATRLMVQFLCLRSFFTASDRACWGSKYLHYSMIYLNTMNLSQPRWEAAWLTDRSSSIKFTLSMFLTSNDMGVPKQINMDQMMTYPLLYLLKSSTWQRTVLDIKRKKIILKCL